MFFAPALGVGRRLTLEAWRHCAHKCQIRTPPRKGLTTEAGFCARYATRRKLPRRADRQLDEQACNRDHDSSDPCGQTKNSRRSPRSIGISRLPYTSLVLGYLDPPSFSLRSIPDSGAITNYFMPASRTRLPGHILCGDHWSP